MHFQLSCFTLSGLVQLHVAETPVNLRPRIKLFPFSKFSKLKIVLIWYILPLLSYIQRVTFSHGPPIGSFGASTCLILLGSWYTPIEPSVHAQRRCFSFCFQWLPLHTWDHFHSFFVFHEDTWKVCNNLLTHYSNVNPTRFLPYEKQTDCGKSTGSHSLRRSGLQPICLSRQIPRSVAPW